MSRIVVFGGNGFIGRHLSIKLAELSDNSVVVFDRFSSYKTGSENPFSEYKNIEIITGNFFNRSEVDEVLEGVDVIFHLVSNTNPASSANDPLIDIDTNIRSSVELFELCVANKVRKVIFLSSGGTVYGQLDSEKINEESVTQPVSPYAIGKLTIEHYLRYFKHHHGLNYMVYRVANPYGPGQNLKGKQGVIPIFLNLAFNKQPLTIFGPGDMVRDYLYITDLIDMIAGSYDKNNIYAEYNIGSGTGTTINQLVGIIEKIAGYKLAKKHTTTPDTYVEKIVLDISRFTSEFNLRPSITLEDGISRTWNYVRQED